MSLIVLNFIQIRGGTENKSRDNMPIKKSHRVEISNSNLLFPITRPLNNQSI